MSELKGLPGLKQIVLAKQNKRADRAEAAWELAGRTTGMLGAGSILVKGYDKTIKFATKPSIFNALPKCTAGKVGLVAAGFLGVFGTLAYAFMCGCNKLGEYMGESAAKRIRKSA